MRKTLDMVGYLITSHQLKPCAHVHDSSLQHVAVHCEQQYCRITEMEEDLPTAGVLLVKKSLTLSDVIQPLPFLTQKFHSILIPCKNCPKVENLPKHTKHLVKDLFIPNFPCPYNAH